MGMTFVLFVQSQVPSLHQRGRTMQHAGRTTHTWTQVNVSIQRFYRPHLMLTACQKENDSGDPQRLWFIQKSHTDNLQPHAKCCTSKQVKKTA